MESLEISRIQSTQIHEVKFKMLYWKNTIVLEKNLSLKKQELPKKELNKKSIHEVNE